MGCLNFLNEQKININDDKYLPYIEGNNEIEYIIVKDQMMGLHILFGNVLYEANNYGSIWEYTKLNELITFDKNPQQIAIIIKFNELFGFVPLADPELFIFSHIY